MTPNFLAETVQQVRDRFVAEKTILSFQEYLEVVRQSPAQQARDAATYVRDCWSHFGTTRVTRPYGQHPARSGAENPRCLSCHSCR